MKLDCIACKGEKTMEPTKIPKFNMVLRIIGVIIVIPSVLGILSSVIALVGVVGSDPYSPATASSVNSIAIGVSFVFGALSLVAGVLGWFLLMQRNVYKCVQCGYIIDRA